MSQPDGPDDEHACFPRPHDRDARGQEPHGRVAPESGGLRGRAARGPGDEGHPPDGGGGGRSPSPEARAIAGLLRERGIGRHALFLTQREGSVLPDGLEAVSGFALDERGRVHGFWLAWNARRQALTLEPFYAVEDPDAAFARDTEYQAARRALGLDRP